MPFLTSAQFQTPVVPVHALQKEQALTACAGRRDEVFRAVAGRKIRLAGLQADDPFKRPPWIVFQLQAGVITSIGKAGASNIAIFFYVLVVGRTRTQASALETGQGIAQFASYIETLGTQMSGGGVLVLMTVIVAVPMIVVMAMVVTVAAAMQGGAVRVAVLVFVAVTGQTIAAFTIRVGGTNVATLNPARLQRRASNGNLRL